MSINVGILGLGFMGQMHARCYQALPGVNLVTCSDGQEEKRASFQQEFGCLAYPTYAEMLYHPGLDLVDVCVPTYLHQEAVVQAAQAGKHVLCEKPIALEVAEADEMLAAAEKMKVSFMVAHVIRFWPEYMAIKRVVDGGELGEVRFVEARRLGGRPQWSWQNWYLDAAKSGGAVVDLQIHDLDFIRYLLGDPKEVFAVGRTSDRGSWDSIATTMTGFPGGAAAVATASLDLAAQFPFCMGLVVNCARGTLLLDSARKPSLVMIKEDQPPVEVELAAPPIAKAEGLGNLSDLGGYYNEIAYFVACLAAGQAPTVVTAWDAREALRLCLAARESAAGGKVVRY